MHTYCGKVISYFNDKYHGGLDATANPRFRELVFVQINAIKWIVLSSTIRFCSRKKFAAREISRDLRET